MARVEIPFTVEKPVSSNLQSAAGASVQVNIRGGGPATVYAAETGGGTTANPLTTDANGRIEGWLDEGQYNLVVSGAGFTTYTQPFDATSAGSALALDGSRLIAATVSGSALVAASVAGSKLIDGTIGSAKLDPNVVPLGTVLDWWRPVNTIAVPTGWAISDGSVVSSGNHDFGTGSSITLPDLRNAFVLGANIANSDGQAPVSNSDAVGSAPGIGGVGGSHFRNLQHSHTVNGHTHNATTSTNGAHTHVVNINTSGGSLITQGSFTGSTDLQPYDHIHTVKGNTGSAGDHTHTLTTDSQSPGTNNALSTTQDVKPKLVGLLKIIKVKH